MHLRYILLVALTVSLQTCQGQDESDIIVDINWFLKKLIPKIVNLVNSTVVASSKPFNLGKMNISQDAVTMSGFGMGGCFAQQVLLSHSNIFSGFALYRPHGVYTCGNKSEGNVNHYLQTCVQQKAYNYSELIATTEMYQAKKLIEPLRKLATMPLYYHFGTANPKQFSALPYVDTFRFWSRYILNPDLVYAKMLESDFLIPTNDTGRECDKPADKTFYVGNCNYHVPFIAVKYLLGHKLELKYASKNLLLQPLKVFSQTEFFEGLTSEQTGMASTGLIYIPFNCQNQLFQCYLHIHFHDVLTSADNNGTENYRDSGLLRFAEQNNIIVLLPQAQKTTKVPLDSWDCYGSTGSLYATKNGTQIQIIKGMLDRLLMGD